MDKMSREKAVHMDVTTLSAYHSQMLLLALEDYGYSQIVCKPPLVQYIE